MSPKNWNTEKPNRKIFDAALRALGVENREHVLMVGDSLSSDIQGGNGAGLDTCWFNPSHAENPGKVCPTYEIDALEQLYPLIMEPEELANLGLKHPPPPAVTISVPRDVWKLC